MKTLAKSLAIFLLVTFSTDSPILAINLVTSEFTVNLEFKLLLIIDRVFSIVKKEAKNNTTIQLINIYFEQNFKERLSAINSMWGVIVCGS